LSQISASAGIGAFDASFSEGYISEELAFTLAEDVFYPLVNDPAVGCGIDSVTEACFGSDCLSRFFASSAQNIQPWPPSITQSPEADIFVVQDQQGFQGDYWDVDSADESFTTNQCQAWGEESEYGFMVCIKQSSLDRNHLIAGTILWEQY